MKIADRATRTTTARFVWGGLALLFLVLLFVSRSKRSEALNTEIQDAQSRANGYANTTVAGQATVDVADGAITFVPKELTVALQSDVFTDPTVARVRVWDAKGLLLASTDPSDDVGGVVAASDVALNASLQGTTSAQVAQQPFTYATVGTLAKPTDLLQVFAPLRLRDQVQPAGAVQVDYLYATLRAAAADPWKRWSDVCLALSVVFALLFVVSMLRAPIRAEQRRAMATVAPADVATTAPTATRTPSPGVAGESVELREELQAAREQLQQASEAYAFLEARMKDGQGAHGRSPDVEAASQRIAELEAALNRAEAEAALARTSSATNEELNQVRQDADERVAQMERQMQQESTKTADAQARAQAAEDALLAAKADVASARERADAAKREQPKATAVSEPEPAKPSPSDPVDLIAELEAKVAEAEVRAKEAEEDALRLTPEANALRARLARSVASKKFGPTN